MTDIATTSLGKSPSRDTMIRKGGVYGDPERTSNHDPQSIKNACEAATSRLTASEVTGSMATSTQGSTIATSGIHNDSVANGEENVRSLTLMLDSSTPVSWETIGKQLVEAREALDVATAREKAAAKELTKAQEQKRQAHEEVKAKAQLVAKLAAEFTKSVSVISQTLEVPKMLEAYRTHTASQSASSQPIRSSISTTSNEFNPFNSMPKKPIVVRTTLAQSSVGLPGSVASAFQSRSPEATPERQSGVPIIRMNVAAPADRTTSRSVPASSLTGNGEAVSSGEDDQKRQRLLTETKDAHSALFAARAADRTTSRSVPASSLTGNGEAVSSGEDDQKRQRLLTETKDAHSALFAARKKLSYSKSLFRGVRKVTSDGMFEARISINGQDIPLGRYADEEEAARQYDTAARKHRKNAAILNFITDEDRALGCKSAFE